MHTGLKYPRRGASHKSKEFKTMFNVNLLLKHRIIFSSGQDAGRMQGREGGGTGGKRDRRGGVVEARHEGAPRPEGHAPAGRGQRTSVTTSFASLFRREVRGEGRGGGEIHLPESHVTADGATCGAVDRVPLSARA